MELTSDVSTRSTRTRVMLASLIGTSIEWYDFFAYGTAAAIVFGGLFFPGFDPVAGTLLAFSTFAIGFVARPIGGIVFGHYGDRIGRKSMLVLTLLLMGTATLLIGLLPTYATIGIAAPILLVALRFVQGFALGGEWGGAILMSVEHAPTGRRGFFGSWPQVGCPIGVILSTVVFLPLTALPGDQFLAWGWRIPFLLSAVLVVVGLVVRLTVAESPDFEEARAGRQLSESPVLEVLRSNPREILLVAGASICAGAFFYLLLVFNLGYATQVGIDQTTMLLIVLVTSVLGALVIPVFGAISDRVGRRTPVLVGQLLIGVIVFPVYWALDSGSTIAVLVVYAVATVAAYLPWAVWSALFSEMFGTRVRCSGVSLGLTLGTLFGGAIAPLVAAALMTATGSVWSIAAYVLVLDAISIACLVAIPNRPANEPA